MTLVVNLILLKSNLSPGSVKKEYTNLFQSFKKAWNTCKSFLGDQGTMIVPFLQGTWKRT